MPANEEIQAEYERARRKFPPFHSAHEGYAILLEEVLELQKEVFWGNKQLARAEAVQVGAMALALIEECYADPA